MVATSLGEAAVGWFAAAGWSGMIRGGPAELYSADVWSVS